MQFLLVEIKRWYGLQSFTSTGDWYGQSVPDIGFVQLDVQELPSLTLGSQDFYVKVGMRMSTVGHPMGTLPLAVMGKLNQVTPSLRQGIVSSVFPFPTPKPHGFTVDIIQQGGSSGSPIFPLGEKTVIGMMSTSVVDPTPLQTAQGAFVIPQNTNISIAEAIPDQRGGKADTRRIARTESARIDCGPIGMRFIGKRNYLWWRGRELTWT